jgi:hypothetical protein
MDRKTKRAMVTALVKAGRRDLARQVVGAPMKVLKKLPEVAEDDPNLMAFFKPLMGRGRIGFDEQELNGALDFGSWGDIGFQVDDENIYVWIGDAAQGSNKGFNYMFKDGKAAAQVVLDLLAVQKKAEKTSG